MARRTEQLVDRLLASLGIRRIPCAEAVRRIREAAAHCEARAAGLRAFAAQLEATIGTAGGGSITIHELSDEADDVRARQRLA